MTNSKALRILLIKLPNMVHLQLTGEKRRMAQEAYNRDMAK